MNEDRLHIHLVHLEEVKPSEGPVKAPWQTQDSSQVQLCNTHISIFTFNLSLSCFPLPLCLEACVSPPSAQCFLSPSLILLVLARFCMCSYCVLSPFCPAYHFPFMSFVFFFLSFSVISALLFLHSLDFVYILTVYAVQIWCCIVHTRIYSTE